MKKIVIPLFALTGCLFTTEQNGGIPDGFYRRGDTLRMYGDVGVFEFDGVNYRSFNCRMGTYYRYVDVNGISTEPDIMDFEVNCRVDSLGYKLNFSKRYNWDEPFYVVVQSFKYPPGMIGLLTTTFRRVGIEGLSI